MDTVETDTPQKDDLRACEQRRSLAHEGCVSIGAGGAAPEVSPDPSAGEERGAAFEPSSGAEAAPFPLRWVVTQARFHGVQHHVSNCVEEVLLGLEDDRGIPRFEEMADVPVAFIEAARVQAVQPMHPLGEVGSGQRHHEMEVVPHQAVREARPPEAMHGLRQESDEHAPVGIVDVDLAAPYAARSDVQRTLGGFDAVWSSQARMTLDRGVPPVQMAARAAA